MIAFEVRDMSCDHCVGVISKAVKSVDAGATVHADLATHRVQIDAPGADAATLQAAIEEAGYTPVATSDAAGASSPPNPS